MKRSRYDDIFGAIVLFSLNLAAYTSLSRCYTTLRAEQGAEQGAEQMKEADCPLIALPPSAVVNELLWSLCGALSTKRSDFHRDTIIFTFALI